MSRKDRKAWTDDEVETMNKMRSDGFTFSEIGHAIGRAWSTVRQKYHSGADNFNQKKQRRLCLKCRQYFDSEGPGNRRCPSCDHQVKSKGSPMYEYPFYLGGRL